MEYFKENICIFFKNIFFLKKVFIIFILKDNEDWEVVFEFVKFFVI